MDKGELPRRWILNEDILDKQAITDSLRKDIKEFFDLNLTPGMNTATIWDAFKAVIKGRLLNWNAIEKTRNEKLTLVQNELKKVELELKKIPGKKKLEKKLKLLKQRRNSFENQKIVWNLKRLNQKHLEGANKPGKFLANQLKRKKESN